MSLRRSATGGVGLALRQLRSGLGPSLLVAAVVAVTVLLAVATPAVLSRYADAELRARLAAVPDVSRALSGDGYSPLPTDAPGSSAAVWAPVTEAVDAFRARLGQPARAGVGAPILQVRTTDAYVTAPGLPGRLVGLALVADPGFDARVRWIAGAPPRLDETPPTQNADGTFTIPADAPPVPIGLSERSSAQLRAPVGTVLGSGPGYLVAGIYRPRDPAALPWRASAGLVQPGVRLSADGTPTLVLAAVVSPRTPGTVGSLRDGTLRILLPLDADAWRSRDATRVGAQLRAATLRGLDVTGQAGDTQVVLMRTGATVAIDESVRRVAALQTTTALAAAGPVGVALLVLGLGVGAVLRRWRPALEIASARGASGQRMRGTAALETLVFCVPAAVVAAAIVTVLLPGPPSPAGLAVGAVLALAPAAVAAALAHPGRGARGDLGGRVRTASGAPAFGAARPARRRGRWVVEVVVLVAATVVTWSLVNRGPGQDAAALDPLLVAAPLLLAVAVGVLVLRLYPLPLRAGQRALHRGRSAPALIGVARAVREPTVGLAAVLAILVGVSVGVLSATLGATVDEATRTAARTAVGADVRADVTLVLGGLGSDGTRIPRVAGMRDLAPVAAQGLTPVGGSEAELMTAPTAALHRIRSGLPDSAGRVPAGMDRLRDGAIPLVASRDLGRRVGEMLRLGDRRAVVVGTAPEDAGLGPTQRWVLMDARFTDRVVRSPSRPTLVLVGSTAEDATAVAARFRAALPRAAIVTDAESGYRALRDTPSVASLSVMLTAASALAAALSILAAVLAVLAAARVRDRSVAVLRVLGMSRAQLRRALAAELVPVAVAVLAAGTGLGIGLAALVLGTIDLRPFTGGATLPALTLAPLPLAAVLGGFLLLAGGATAAAARASIRLTPADVIRADV